MDPGAAILQLLLSPDPITLMTELPSPFPIPLGVSSSLDLPLGVSSSRLDLPAEGRFDYTPILVMPLDHPPVGPRAP